MSRWLKVGVDTPFKAAITNAARELGCTRGDAFLAWFRLYSWLDEQTADGRLPGIMPEDLDGVAGRQGLAASLARSGWLTFRDGGCVVVNWDEHNGQNAKRRAMDAKRKNAIREQMRKQGVTPRPLPKRTMPVRMESGQMSASEVDEIRGELSSNNS